jgi:hypothetical protein
MSAHTVIAFDHVSDIYQVGRSEVVGQYPGSIFGPRTSGIRYAVLSSYNWCITAFEELCFDKVVLHN